MGTISKLSCYFLVANVGGRLYPYIGIRTDCINTWLQFIDKYKCNYKMEYAIDNATEIFSKVISTSLDINTIKTMQAKLIQYYQSVEDGMNINYGHYLRRNGDTKFIDVIKSGKIFEVRLYSIVLLEFNSRESGIEFIQKINTILDKGSNVLIMKNSTIITIYYKDYLIFNHMKIVDGEVCEKVVYDIEMDNYGNPIIVDEHSIKKVITYQSQQDDNSILVGLLVKRFNNSSRVFNYILDQPLYVLKKNNGEIIDEAIEILNWEKDRLIQSLKAGIDILLPTGKVIQHELVQPNFKFKECNINESLFKICDVSTPLFKQFIFGLGDKERTVDFYFYIRSNFNTSSNISTIEELFYNFNSKLNNDEQFQIDFIQNTKSKLEFYSFPELNNRGKFYDHDIFLSQHIGYIHTLHPHGVKWIKLSGDGIESPKWKLNLKIQEIVIA